MTPLKISRPADFPWFSKDSIGENSERITFYTSVRPQNTHKSLDWFHNKHGGGTIKHFTSIKTENFPPGDSTLYNSQKTK